MAHGYWRHSFDLCFITLFFFLIYTQIIIFSPKHKTNWHIPTVCLQRRLSGKDNSTTPQGIIYYSSPHSNLFHLTSFTLNHRTPPVMIHELQHTDIDVTYDGKTENWDTFQNITYMQVTIHVINTVVINPDWTGYWEGIWEGRKSELDKITCNEIIKDHV